MAPYRGRRTINAVDLLNWRSRGLRDAGTLIRHNLKVLRAIILQDNRSFIKVWSKTSKSTIMYENGKIYFENYQNCYSWYLGWDVSQETLYVKSVQNKETPLARQAGLTQNTVMHLAIFDAFPLQPVGILEISKKIFGNGVTDVALSQSVLAVSYSNKSVKLYSLEHIVHRYMTEKLTLGKQSLLLGGKTVGEAPFGIPVNIQITECPPVIFEVSCSNNGVQIGGYPWHYIYTPPHKHHKGTHHICSLKDNFLATGGIQNMNCCSLESDCIFFHPDDSGRIIHVGPTTINVLKILGELISGLPSKVVKDFSMMTQRENNVCCLCDTGEIPCIKSTNLERGTELHCRDDLRDDVFAFHLMHPKSQVTVTSSGRRVKRRFHQLDDDPDQETFRLVEYEDELDLMVVVVTNGEEGEGKARIRLHDNQSGQLQRTIDLVEPWDETFQHELYFDKDTIIHIEQKNTNFCCHVYKLNTTRG